MLFWCIKQVKDFIFKLISLLKLQKLLFSFTSGGVVNEVVDNQTNFQGCKYKFDLRQCQTFTAIHFANREVFVRLSQELYHKKSIYTSIHPFN